MSFSSVLSAKCNYQHLNTHFYGRVYGCTVEELKITNPNEVIPRFNGRLDTGRSNKSVEFVFINKQFASHLPVGFTKTFPNIWILLVHKSNLEFLQKSDFSDLIHLKALSLNDNKIEFITEDVFEDLHNLEALSLAHNNLRIIPQNIFQHLPNLKRISLNNNHLKKIDSSLFKNNMMLEMIALHNNKLHRIGPNLLNPLRNLKDIWLINNECINEHFPNTTSMQKLITKIKQKCYGRREKVN